MRIHRVVRGAALTALLLFFACGEDGDHYAPLGTDSTPRATVVAGVVRDAGKVAVADALVMIEPASEGVAASTEWLAENPGAANKTTPGRRVTTTNGRGRFAFEQVDAGDYFLQVIADDHLGAMHSIRVPDRMAFVDTLYVDVNLTPTGTFSGIATLEGATNHVGIVVFAEGTSYVAVTGSSGSYELTDVPVGSYTVHAMRPGYDDDTEIGTITTAGENVALASMLLKLNSNIPPVATIASASPQLPTIPVDFVASGSDADGTVVLYEWDWEDDGTFDYSDNASANTSHTYTLEGNYTAKLRVTDDGGAIGLAAIQMTIAFPTNRVYMALAGSDANDGSFASPVATLAKAYQVAQLEGKTEILIQEGTYAGQVPAFQPNIDVLGGRTLPLWEESFAAYSTFTFGATRATASNITTPTLIRRVSLTMTSAGGPSQNSIALYSLGSDADLHFEQCRFQAFSALAGTSGSPGSTGSSSGNGFPGLSGSCDGPRGTGGSGGTSPGGCAGGPGGNGGVEGPNNGVVGGTGGCSGGTGGAGGLGDSGGVLFCDAVGGPGANGSAGVVGVAGNDGLAGSEVGFVAGNEWNPNSSGAGSAGQTGRGGGGGGGGGGQGGNFCDDGGGNGGGGGGGGGSGGGPGQGGAGGRATFCVMLVNSSPGFDGCHFQRGIGGTGGSGGSGGSGGIGGNGGIGATACTAEVGRGGSGGAGGTGGQGGGGAGGPGGPSFGIYKTGTSNPFTIGNTFAGGGPGVGGAGASGAPNGPAGMFGTTN